MLITAISAQNPARITVAGHNAVTGQVIAIDSTNSTPPLSGDYVCTRIDADTFSVPVNVTGAGNAGNAYPVLFCDYEEGNNANSGITYALRFKDLTNGATAARLFPGFQVRMKASPDPTSLGQNATWTDGPLPASFVPASSTNSSPIVFTKVGHGLVTGDTVLVYNHSVNTNANGIWEVVVSGDTFALINADGSNSVGNGTGGATGTVGKMTNSVVSLATALTKNIALVGNQNTKTAWTPSANVTSIITTECKEGFGSQSIAVATGFTTGLAAFFATGLLDLSAYQQVSFWIKQASGTLAADGDISLTLCSDAAGVTPVNTIAIPNLGATATWNVITIDLGSALGAAIQSIGFVVNTDRGAQTFILDSIIACKASNLADSLTLSSLLGKNTGTESWYGIRSINETRVVLDNETINTVYNTGLPPQGYMGTTETILTYKREAVTILGSLNKTNINDSGTDGNPIILSGGWNRTDMSTQTGETFFDGQNGVGNGIALLNNSYIEINNISCFRYQSGINIAGGKFNTVIDAYFNNNQYGINIGSGNNNTIDIHSANNNKQTGIQDGGIQNKIKTFAANSNLQSGISIGGGKYSSYAAGKNNNNRQYGVFVNGSENKISIAESRGNILASINNYTDINYLNNSGLDSAIKYLINTTFINSFLWSTNENNNADTHFGYTDGGLISSDVTTVHTAGGMSWKLSPTSTTRSATYPLPLTIAKVACAANVDTTVKAWFRRDNTGLTARLICKGGQLLGLEADISSSMSAAADVWQELSIVLHPTQKGVVEILAEAWGGTAYNAWSHDVTVS